MYPTDNVLGTNPVVYIEMRNVIFSDNDNLF